MNRLVEEKMDGQLKEDPVSSTAHEMIEAVLRFNPKEQYRLLNMIAQLHENHWRTRLTKDQLQLAETEQMLEQALFGGTKAKEPEATLNPDWYKKDS